MYTYTIPEEQTEKLTEKTKKYSDLLNQFKEVDKKYQPATDEIKLQKKSFEMPTEQEIKKQADSSLEEYKKSELQNIDDDYNTKSTVIDEKIKSETQSLDNKKDETKELYTNLKDNASKDAIKRGLARSSIVINILDAFDKNMVKEINKINEEIQSKVSSLNSQKDLLTEQRQSALNAFDISYALKLTNKIDEINKSLAEQEQKVIEYNNQIAQKEAEYEQKRQKSNLEYAEYIAKHGTDAIDEMKREEKFNYAKDYLMSLPKSDAIVELNTNTALNSELGAKYFNKLRTIINSLKEE